MLTEAAPETEDGAHVKIFTPLGLLGFLKQCHAKLCHHQKTGTRGKHETPYTKLTKKE